MSDGQPVSVPVYQEFMNPLLTVLRTAREVLSVKELDQRVFELMKLPRAVLDVQHPGRPGQSEAAYRLGWTRSYLKDAGLIESAGRGLYRLSKAGEAAGVIDAFEVASVVRSRSRVEDGEDPPEDAEASAAELVVPALRQVHTELRATGELPGPDLVSRALSRFGEKFGTAALSRLDGEALLLAMHGRQSKDSLAYWLEFKDDDEFPALFGSISGGSALKFGIYQAVDGNRWMTGNPRQQEELSLAEAVSVARRQRDQLLAGARVLATFEQGNRNYGALQADLASAAPDLYASAWAHKYFFLLFSSVLAPFHSLEYQRMQLHKLLQEPAEGHYENDGFFVRVAEELGLSTVQLAAILFRRQGAMQSCWRVGTDIGSSDEWPRMRAGGYAAIGWDRVGDLTLFEDGEAGSEALHGLLARHYELEGAAATKAERQLNRFAFAAREGDLVVAMKGRTALGVGRITDPYQFRADDGNGAHRRKVEWLDTTEWSLPEQEGLRSAFSEMNKSLNLIEVERRVLAPQRSGGSAVVSTTTTKATLPPLLQQVARIEAILERKRQVVLYGPPGTGKTYWAERAARQLAARSWFQASFESLTDAQRRELETSAIQLCSFHPAYGYEDFLEGYRPRASGEGNLAFELRDGIFKRLCRRAAQSPSRRFFLIIDEINRGDVPRIFGELLTVLEREKRGREVLLPLSGEAFAVPDNVYVLGTMNTADRSIALLDVALRRRFGFFELPPDSRPLEGVLIEGLPVLAWFEALNRRIVESLGRDARHLQIGHSYFLSAGKAIRELSRFAEVLRDDVVPLLEEYCYDDASALEKILGPKLMHADKRRVNNALFEPGRHAELMTALIESFPEISATPAAIAADRQNVKSVDDEGDAAE